MRSIGWFCGASITTGRTGSAAATIVPVLGSGVDRLGHGGDVRQRFAAKRRLELELGLMKAEGEFLDLAGEFADARLGTVKPGHDVVRGDRYFGHGGGRHDKYVAGGQSLRRRREKDLLAAAIPLPWPLDRAARGGLGGDGEADDRREGDGAVECVHGVTVSLPHRDGAGRAYPTPLPTASEAEHRSPEFGQSEANRHKETRRRAIVTA